jgi:hypothetical protein
MIKSALCPSVLRSRVASIVVALGLAAGAHAVIAQEVKVTLSGGQEIPPVTTPASGTGTVAVSADRSMTGGVTIAGMTPTVAHIHEAAAGANGPIVVPLVKTAADVWSVPPGTKLTPAQYESFQAGNLYFNVHSEAHKAGEIRGQIKP